MRQTRLTGKQGRGGGRETEVVLTELDAARLRHYQIRVSILYTAQFLLLLGLIALSLYVLLTLRELDGADECPCSLARSQYPRTKRVLRRISNFHQRRRRTETTRGPDEWTEDEWARHWDNDTALNDTLPWNLTHTGLIEELDKLKPKSTSSTRLATTVATSTSLYTGPPTLGVKNGECYLDAVGIPVLHAQSQYSSRIGSWMKDSNPKNKWAEKRWITDNYATEVLHEYRDEEDLLNKKQLIKYYVDFLAAGTGGVINNGYYYYHRHDSPFIVRYCLTTGEQMEKEIPGMAHRDCPQLQHEFLECSAEDRDPWLYGLPHNYVDIAVDENGLWIVYIPLDSEESLGVAKLDFANLTIVETWAISAPNITRLANSFIMCGILYGLEDGRRANSAISFAYDLYEAQQLPVNVSWYNPYNKTTMLDYNSEDERLYFYDNGFMLSANVRLHKELRQFLAATPPPRS